MSTIEQAVAHVLAGVIDDVVEIHESFVEQECKLGVVKSDELTVDDFDSMDPSMINFSKTELSIITTEGKITNINYRKEKDLIHSIIASISGVMQNVEWLIGGDEKTCLDILVIHLNTGDIRIANIGEKSNADMEKHYVKLINKGPKQVIDDSVLRIGCNYGEFISSAYIRIKSPNPRSNRGRKPYNNKAARRKGIGLRRYFNSEITFTMISDENKTSQMLTKDDAVYHMKLYTNGKIQVPSVRDDDVYIVTPTVLKVIDLVTKYSNVKVDKTKPCEIEYIKSIMRNYKFRLTYNNIIHDNVLIDIKKFKLVFLLCKRHFKSQIMDESNENENEEYPDGVTSELFDQYKEVLTKYPLVLVKYNIDKYVGLILKFATPSLDYPDRNTTVKIFHSGKINVDACNTFEQCEHVKKILLNMLVITMRACIYIKDD